MKNASLLIFLFLLSILLSCKEQSDEYRVYNEVMEIHDAVMPEMQTIFQLKKELALKQDSLKTLDENSQLNIEIETRIGELKNANESMMQWMRNFNSGFDGDENLTKMEYLELEKVKIQNVSDEFETSIKNAQGTLSKMKK